MAKLEDVLADAHVRACGSRYAEGLAARWDAQLQQLAKTRFIVPVVGVQGAGKSTLLTALLFDRPVLPVDADETTCVPVEIVYGTSALATVHYADGRSEQAPATEDDLSRFVHQASNPGNRLAVARVVVESPAEMLKSGAVLVDLPGLGSLTKANAETTQAYLNESSGLIYLLRTVPPMTKSEALSLSLIWPRLPIIFFAQNRWTDESDEEAAGGREHNAFVIGDLAKKLGRALDEPQRRIDVVCAYGALAGMLAGDPAKVAHSGIKELEGRLSASFSEWPALRRGRLTAAVRADLEGCRGAAQSRVADLGSDQATARKALEAEFTRQQEALAILGARINTVKNHLDEFTAAQGDGASAWRTESRSALRNRMRTLMRKGVVDGPRLDRALMDEQQAVGEPAYAAARDAVLEVVSLIGKDLAGVDDWQAESVSGRGVGKEESTRFENLLKPLAGAAGVLVGSTAGAEVGGAAGAAVGTFIGGPPGTVIGGVAGLLVGAAIGALGGFLGSWAGQTAADQVLASRANANEPEVFRAIDQYADAVVGDLSGTAWTFSDRVHGRLRTWHAEMLRRADSEHATRRADIDAGSAQRAERLGSLQRDVGCLEAALARIAPTDADGSPA